MEPLSCQRHLFSLEAGVRYLNCAAYSPLLRSTKVAGISSLEIKSNPQNIVPSLHFEKPRLLREKLATLINTEEDRIAIVPSASYGLAAVALNLHRLPNIQTKRHIIVLQDEFPNDTYAFDRVLPGLNLTVKVVSIPTEGDFEKVGEAWNQKILNAIDPETACILLPQVHWIYGVLFDLPSISKKCHSVGSLLIIDGTQSVGAMPFDIQVINPDAVVCSGYKWLFSPYSIGFAYYGPFFDDGIPVEESWMNRVESDKFSAITNLQKNYRSKAQRYNMGEFTQFILGSMFLDSVEQLLKWGVVRIHEYVKEIGKDAVKELRSLGCKIILDPHRAAHLFGILLPDGVDGVSLYNDLRRSGVVVSLRGKAVRVSLNVFNEREDMDCLVSALKKLLNPRL